MDKIVKESDLRKQFMNMVLDLTPMEFVNLLEDFGEGTYDLDEIDWDVQDGRSIITKFLPEEE